MGDEQRLPFEELISRSRESFEDGRDFTLAVEEEFAILDPETHELVEPLRGAPGARHRARRSRSFSWAS